MRPLLDGARPLDRKLSVLTRPRLCHSLTYRRFEIQDLTVETFPTLATLLRMSKRYRIEKPAQDIVARIRAEWPATLA